jgi:hypothetical protein
MGFMDKFSDDAATTRPTLTVTFDPEDAKRVNDAAFALKTKGCKSRGDFARKALLQAVDEVEQGFGGREAVIAAANSVDPEGTRHQRKTRASNGEQQTMPETPKGKPKK